MIRSIARPALTMFLLLAAGAPALGQSGSAGAVPHPPAPAGSAVEAGLDLERAPAFIRHAVAEDPQADSAAGAVR
jgi:hypothetical protein